MMGEDILSKTSVKLGSKAAFKQWVIANKIQSGDQKVLDPLASNIPIPLTCYWHQLDSVLLMDSLQMIPFHMLMDQVKVKK